MLHQQIQFLVGLTFPNPIPACLASVSVFLIGHLLLLLSLLHFFFTFDFCQEHFIHTCKTPVTCAWLPLCWRVGRDYSSAWKRWSLKISQLDVWVLSWKTIFKTAKKYTYFLQRNLLLTTFSFSLTEETELSYFLLLWLLQDVVDKVWKGWGPCYLCALCQFLTKLCLL